MNTLKKTVSIFICVVLLMSTIIMSDYNYIGSLKLIANAVGEHHYMINGIPVNCDSVQDPGEGKNEEYIKSIYNYIWGVYYSNDFSSSDNILKNIEYNERNLTYENLRNFVKRSEPGTVLKVETVSENQSNSENGRSFLIVSVDVNGFTVFEYTNTRKETYYTWESFCDVYKYSTIRFLKWPNSFFSSADSFNDTDYKKPERPLYFDSKSMLHGDDVRWVQQKLVDLGYGISADGYYSKNTETAVKLFQKDYYLTVTGIVESTTAEMLDSPKKKPGDISLSIDYSSSDADLSIGDILTVTWDKVDDAEGYHIFVYNTKGEIVDQIDNVTTNRASFVMGKSGTYFVKGFAQNDKFIGETSTLSNKIKVHNSFTVKFVDFDGTLLNKQTVAYGQDAAVPVSPKRDGYSFKGWDLNFDNITSSMTITAQYVKKTYNVSFRDKNGEIIGQIQNVPYGEAAEEPDTSDVPGFLGWNKDFDVITASTTVSAVTVDEDIPLPFSISDTRAKREGESGGYTVNFKVTSQADVKKIARAVVALKTTSGKFLTMTESSAFTVAANGSKTLKVVVPYSKAATVVEIFLVENYSDLVPLSQVAEITEIETDDNFTDWIPEEEAPAIYYSKTEPRTEYSYKTRTTTSENYNSKTGWILDRTVVASMTPSGWSGYTRTASSNKYDVLADGQRHLITEVESKPVTYTSGYNLECWVTQSTYSPHYRHYWNYNHGPERSSYGQNYRAKWVSVDYFNGMGIVDIGARYNGVPAKNWDYCGYNMAGVAGRTDNDGYIYFNTSTTTDKYYVYRTQNYYPIYKYYFYKDSDWSDWTPESVAVGKQIDENTSVIDVRERTTNRYEVNDPTVTNTGKTRTITGAVDKALAGKQATLFIYKIGEASDYTNEFIGQTVIGSDGTYKFNFKLREEPSVETGDFTVTLGIEGANAVIYLDSIKAPVAQYTVNIKDYDGRIIDTQTVNKGESAKLPSANPTREGYTFAGWNYSNASIYEDTDIQALYVQDEYTVVFIDWANEKFSMQTGYHYDDALITPDLNYLVEVDKLDENGNKVYDENNNVVKELVSTANEAYTANGWKWKDNNGILQDVFDGMTVKGNMVITADYDEKTCTVNFYDYDKNIIDSQTVQYGKSAVAPNLVSDDQHVFISWDSYDFSCITTDLDIEPIFSYTENSAVPTANIQSGIFSESKTLILSCETPNSSIKYSINNGEEMTYNQPIVVDETMEIYYYSCAEGFNASEKVNGYYIINTPDNTEQWKYPVHIYCDDKLIDTLLVSAGQTIESANWVDEKYISGYEQHTETFISGEQMHYKYYHRHSNNLYGSNESMPHGEKHTIDLINPLGTCTSFNWEGYYPCPVCGVGDRWLFEKSYSTPVYSTKTISTPIYSKHSVFKDRAAEYAGEGQQVEGYYTDKALTSSWNTENAINGEKSLYIKLIDQIFNVTFVTPSGETIDTQSVKYCGSANAPENIPVDEGKVFVGWDSDEYLCVTKDLTITANIKNISDLPSVTLNKTELVTISGMKYQLTASVFPSEYQNNTIVWTSDDESVATVDANGLVTAIAPGTAEITASLSGDIVRTAICKIIVSFNDAEDITLVSGSSLSIANKKLLGVKPDSNTVYDVFSEISSDSLEAYSSEGRKLGHNDKMETGSRIILIDKNGKVLDTVTVIVMGDVNGDGIVNVKDATMISRKQVNKENILGDAKLAADIDNSGEILQSDASIILEYIEGKKTVLS